MLLPSERVQNQPPTFTEKQYLFCFIDRAFSMMKTKNKPTKCTN